MGAVRPHPSTLRSRPDALARALVVLGPLLSAALVLVACGSDVRVGRLCEYNSDCPSELACVNGHCGSECRAHRDCPFESECLIASDTGLGRCRLPSDTCEQCETGLVCGTDELCHSPCGALCPSDGACVEGACIRASADAGTADAGGGSTDGGASFARVACSTSASCTSPMECVQFQGATRVCRAPCTTLAECGEAATCAHFGDTGEDYCSIPCDPVTNAGCAPGDSCDLVDALSGVLERSDASMVYVQTWECRTSTSAAVETPCSLGEQCGVGQGCYYSGATDDAGLAQDCVAHCYVDAIAGETGACSAGFECRAWSAGSPVPGHRIGYCRRVGT